MFIKKHTNDDFFDDFPKISKHFPKTSEDSTKVVRRPDSRFRELRTFSDEESMMFWSYRNNSKYFLRDYVTIAMQIFSLLKITCYFHMPWNIMLFSRGISLVFT